MLIIKSRPEFTSGRLYIYLVEVNFQSRFMRLFKRLILISFFAILAILISFAVYARNCSYNVDVAVKHLRKNAQPKPVRLCAGYVRQAITAGGVPTFIRPPMASWYSWYLPMIGFGQVDVDNLSTYTPQKGDLVVFGSTSRHPYGHIAMYDGNQWISDFKQRSIFVYKNNDSSWGVFRRNP